MSENYDQNSDAFFDCVSESFRLNFAIRDYVHKKLWKSTDSCRFLCLCLVTCTHRLTHKKRKEGTKMVTVSNSEIQFRTN